MIGPQSADIAKRIAGFLRSAGQVLMRAHAGAAAVAKAVGKVVAEDAVRRLTDRVAANVADTVGVFGIGFKPDKRIFDRCGFRRNAVFLIDHVALLVRQLIGVGAGRVGANPDVLGVVILMVGVGAGGDILLGIGFRHAVGAAVEAAAVLCAVVSAIRGVADQIVPVVFKSVIAADAIDNHRFAAVIDKHRRRADGVGCRPFGGSFHLRRRKAFPAGLVFHRSVARPRRLFGAAPDGFFADQLQLARLVQYVMAFDVAHRDLGGNQFARIRLVGRVVRSFPGRFGGPRLGSGLPLFGKHRKRQHG